MVHVIFFILNMVICLRGCVEHFIVRYNYRFFVKAAVLFDD